MRTRGQSMLGSVSRKSNHEFRLSDQEKKKVFAELVAVIIII